MSLSRFSFSPLACAALLLLAACNERPDAYYGEDTVPTAAIEIAPVAPPPPSEESTEVFRDTRTQVWRPGHWVYENQHFSWVSGEVLTRPSPTAVWSPDRWEHRLYGWVFIHGYWQ